MRSYVEDSIFNMLVLVGTFKTTDYVAEETINLSTNQFLKYVKVFTITNKNQDL
jgi:5-hydroxyisourate hydrolase-like protein (transthyretin family)